MFRSLHLNGIETITIVYMVKIIETIVHMVLKYLKLMELLSEKLIWPPADLIC